MFDLLLEGSRSQSDVAYFPLFQELLCVFIKVGTVLVVRMVGWCSLTVNYVNSTAYSVLRTVIMDLMNSLVFLFYKATTVLLIISIFQHQLGGEGSLIRFIAMLWTIPVSNFQLRLNSFVDLVCRRTTGQQQSVQRRNPVSSVTVARGLLVAVEYLQTRQEAFKAAMMLDECPGMNAG